MVIIHIDRGTILSGISVVSKSTIKLHRHKHYKYQAQNAGHVERVGISSALEKLNIPICHT